MDLTRATVLVTGANRGIGAAIAAELVTRPLARLLLGVRDPAQAELPSAPAGGARQVRAVHMDLGSRAAVAASWASLAPEEQALDVLVNNAGQMTGGLLEDQDLDAIYSMFQVNLLSTVQLTQLALPGMVERAHGLIVNNASISAYAYFPTATTYSASKAGVVAFSEALRRELEPTGVSVLHLVTPGVRTDMLTATEDVYARHLKTEGWTSVEPADWAVRVVKAMESGAHVLRPGGRLEVARLASRGPAFVLDAITRRGFSRDPRG